MGCFSVDAPDPINPAQVGRESLQTQIDLAPQVFGAVQQYALPYAQLADQVTQQQVLGSAHFDVAKALASDPWAQQNRAQIEANAREQGISPEQWLQNHIRDNPADANMQALKDRFTTRSGGMLSLYEQTAPRLGELQAQANTQQRAADIADVAALGGKAREAYLAANPELAAAMRNLSGSVANGANTAAPQVNYNAASAGTLGPAAQTTAAMASGGSLYNLLESDATQALGSKTALQAEMERQAMEQLAANGRLSAEDRRAVEQATRAAYADRGVVMGNRAIVDEALNTEAMQRKRRAEAQAAALGIDAAGQAQTLANRNYAQGVQGAGQTLSMYNAGQQNQVGLANTAAQNAYGLAQFGADAEMSRYNAGMDYQTQLANAGLTMQHQQQGIQNQMALASLYAQQAQDPYQMVLGRSGAPAQSMGAVGQAQATNTGAPSFDPFNQGIMSIYAGNQANEMAARTATANNYSSLFGSMIGMGGMLGAAAIMAPAAGAGGAAAGAGAACWVAREVYGEESPTWPRFRKWLLEEAPTKLVVDYWTKGPDVAERVRRSPALRTRVRAVMDAILAENLNLQPA